MPCTLQVRERCFAGQWNAPQVKHHAKERGIGIGRMATCYWHQHALLSENSLSLLLFFLFRKTQTTVFSGECICHIHMSSAMEMNSKKHSMNSKQHLFHYSMDFPIIILHSFLEQQRSILTIILNKEYIYSHPHDTPDQQWLTLKLQVHDL